jgi:hypothetical protein
MARHRAKLVTNAIHLGQTWLVAFEACMDISLKSLDGVTKKADENAPFAEQLFVHLPALNHGQLSHSCADCYSMTVPSHDLDLVCESTNPWIKLPDFGIAGSGTVAHGNF